MGRREKKLKAAKLQESSASEDGDKKVPKVIESMATDDDEEANEDLSLKIVQKSMLLACNNNPENNAVLNIVTDVKKDGKKDKRKRKKRSEQTEPEVPGDIVDNLKGEEKLYADKAIEISEKDVEENPVEDNAVMRKLLRGPRYFDPPDNSWGTCYNCGEEGHTTVNCISARRKKPCFVCGSFEHNAKLCSKRQDCFICKQRGHRTKDCPEKYKSSKICLKCGDLGHDMFSCKNDYCSNDLEDIQCYACHRFGHLCCVDYGSPKQREISCYRCGRSGHTGLACKGYHADTNDTVSSNSCYKCGGEGHFARECTSLAKNGDTNGMISSNSCYNCGGEGHFARECTTSKKAGKINREPSTPKQKSSKKIRDHKEVKSAPPDRKKNKSQHVEYSSPVKTKHRGGRIMEDPQRRGGWIEEDPLHRGSWIAEDSQHREDPQHRGGWIKEAHQHRGGWIKKTPQYRGGWILEDPQYYYNKSVPEPNWRSPATPIDRRSKILTSHYDDYASSSHSQNPRNYDSSNYAVNRSSGYYQHSNEMRRNYDRY